MAADNASTRLAAGEEIRRTVLGADFVARERQARTEFDAPFQELVTEYLWGGLWNREGLDRPTRALIDVAILAALGGRGQGVAVHVQAALNCGCTEAQIREVLLHVAVLAGVSAGADAFRASRERLAALRPDGPAGAPATAGRGQP